MQTDWTLHDSFCMALGAAAYHQGILESPVLMLLGITVCNAIMRERTGDPDWGKPVYRPLDYVDIVLNVPRAPRPHDGHVELVKRRNGEAGPKLIWKG